MANATKKTPAVERVGVLLVHGVGEQRRFEHLSSEVRNIVRALQQEVEAPSCVSVRVRTSRDGAYFAEQETWLAETEAPVCIDVVRDGKKTEIHVHEVWWADLDEPATLWAQVRFWFWGLSLWSAKRYRVSSRRSVERMILPEDVGPSESRWARLMLFGVGTIFLLVLGSLSFINYVLGRLRLGRIPGPDILVRYIGDVKLFQQRAQEGKGPLTDLGQPPRVPIRRRMVQAMVDVALKGYDRWYLLAHSLGSVVAWNGLTESAHCLPNYLDPQRWARCRNEGIGGPCGKLGVSNKEIGEVEDEGRMRPSRPCWLNHEDVIDRARLFIKLEGFMTYGSPLDKFAHLWPRTVPLNPEERPIFSEGFEWINIYDNTDPVGASIDRFDLNPWLSRNAASETACKTRPTNRVYPASPLLLISHTRYLDFKPDDPGLVDRVARWLLKGGSYWRDFNPKGWVPDRSMSEAAEGPRTLWRMVQWGVVAVAAAAAVAFTMNQVPSLAECLNALVGAKTHWPLWKRVAWEVPWVIAGAALVVAIVGALGRVREDFWIGSQYQHPKLPPARKPD